MPFRILKPISRFFPPPFPPPPPYYHLQERGSEWLGPVKKLFKRTVKRSCNQNYTLLLTEKTATDMLILQILKIL